jgi:hypothetical protein
MKLSRRRVLRASGVAVVLPCLDAFQAEATGVQSQQPIRRMVCVCAPLGFYAPDFFPQQTGRNYELSPHLQALQQHRENFTVISGLMHTGGSPGFAHQATASFLTGAEGAGRPGFRNSISLDQFAAEQMGELTRFPALTLSGEGLGLAWTRTGAQIPADNSPAKVFARMFLKGADEEVRSQQQKLKLGRSILDDVRGQATQLQAALGSSDREKLDEYLSSVRDLERRLQIEEQWLNRPLPVVDAAPPTDISNPSDLIGRTRLLFDLTHLALQTDSTRLVTIMMQGGTAAPPIPGVSLGHHDLSHHGKDPQKLEQLKLIELETLKTVGQLLTKLQGTQEQEANLLDRTTVFLGSNLGDASSHSVKNLPVLLAGGGFRHGQHLAFNADNPPPLCNLFVSMLQRLGLETTSFGNATGTLPGLELA